MTYEQYCAATQLAHKNAMIPLRLAAADAFRARDASLAAAREARDARHEWNAQVRDARHEWDANSAVSSAEYAHRRRDLSAEYRAIWRADSALVLEAFKALPRSLRLEAYTLAESYCYEEDVYEEDGVVMVDTLVTEWARALVGALTALHGADYAAVSDEVRAAYGVGVEEQ